MNTEILDKLEKTPTGLLKDITSPIEASEAPQITALPENEATILNPLESAVNQPAMPQNADAIPGQNLQSQKLNLGQLISGELAAEFLDTGISTIGVIIVKKIFNRTIDKRALQASAAEKKTIAPVANEYLKTIEINSLNPLNALLITVGFIYGAKALEITANKNPGELSDTFKTPSTSHIKKESEGVKYNKDGTPRKQRATGIKYNKTALKK